MQVADWVGTPDGWRKLCLNKEPSRLLGWMGEVGLKNLKARTFIADIQAPLDEETIEAVSSYFPMYWDKAKTEVSREVWQEYERLCLADSAEFILKLPDYYGFVAITAFFGKVKG